MADKKEETKVEAKAEAKAEPKAEPKKPKVDKQKFIENRLKAINKIQDKAKARRAAARLFRKGN